MKSFIAVALGLLFVARFASANLTGCHVLVQAQSRHYSYPSGSDTDTPYDITITNIGTCDVDQVYISIVPEDSGTTVQQDWNLLQLSSEFFWVENMGGALVPNGNFFGSGYITASSASSSGTVATSLASAICASTGDCAYPASAQEGYITCSNLSCNCDQVCIQDGGIPRCETVYDSCAPSTTGSAPVQQCAAAASLTARTSGAWTNNQLYDILVQNVGQCALTGVQLAFNVQSGSTISEPWNLDATYHIENFGSSIQVDGNFPGAGFDLIGGGSVSVSVAAKTCQC